MHLLQLVILTIQMIYLLASRIQAVKGYPIKFNQMKYLLWAIGLYFPAATDYIVNYGREFYPIGFIFVILTIGIFSYSIVAYRLMDIAVIITKGLAYGTLTVAIAGGYIGLMVGVDKIFLGVPWYNPALAHALLFMVVLFALIYVLPQMKIRALDITRRTIFRGRYDYQEELSEATKTISTMLNLDQLGDYLMTKLRDTLMVDKISLFIFDETERYYYLLTSYGLDKEAISNVKIRENSALAGLLRDEAKPIVKEELEATGSVPEQATKLAIRQLQPLQAELCIPLMLKEDLAGILTLANKRTGDMYTDEDLGLLATLANQVALTIEYIKAIDKLSSEKRYVGLGKASMRMAHDIKNPLVPLKTFLQILPEKYPKEFAEMSKIDAEFTGRFYESALEGVDRINLLIERALHYARHPEPVFSEVKLDSILDDVLTQEEVDIKKSSIQLEKKYSPSDNSIMADADQLMELFSNLIANGVDAMEESATKKLTVKTEAFDESISVEISDTGCGIPKDRLDTIFDPFITYKHQGSGLGLAIAKKIVDDHKGSIEINSQAEKGTSFKIILPRKPAQG